MTEAGYDPLALQLAPGRARALPWVSVATGSLVTIVPVIATVPILPPFGLLMLLTWRLLSRFALRPWAAAPLGLFDDLLSGQPLGSAVLLWSACFLLIDVIERRMVFRGFWQDWLIASGAILCCIGGARILALPLGVGIDAALLAQAAATILLFPMAVRLVAWIDRKRALA